VGIRQRIAPDLLKFVKQGIQLSILLGELPARVVQELDEGRRFLFEAPLQRARSLMHSSQAT
jgi:hypothetical protein